MTVDILTPPQDPNYEEHPGPIQDLLVIYGGWSGFDGPEELTAGPDTGSASLVQSIQDMPRMPRQRIRMLALQGDLVGPEHEQRAASFIRRHFHPGSKIIIYGYSAGGANALYLSRLIQGRSRYYNFTTRSFTILPPELAISAQGIARVRIDLLITVDAATGPASGTLNRQVPSCVRRNLNFYQTRPSGIGSHGGPNTADNSNDTVIENVDLTQEAVHDAIDENVSGRVLEAIRGVLGRQIAPMHGPGVGIARAGQPNRPTGWGRGRGIAPRNRWETA